MKKVTLLIPTHYPDGRPVYTATFKRYEREMLRIAGGYTSDGFVNGGWIDSRDGAEYHDQTKRYIIITDHIEGIEGLAKAIGKELGQQAMYLEIAEVDYKELRTR